MEIRSTKADIDFMVTGSSLDLRQVLGALKAGGYDHEGEIEKVAFSHYSPRKKQFVYSIFYESEDRNKLEDGFVYVNWSFEKGCWLADF